MKLSKIEQAAEEKRQEIENVIHEKRIASVLNKEGLRSAEMIGAIRAIDSIQRNLSAQVIRGLEIFQEEKGYEAYGYTNFVDFLDGYENSPMTKRQYYDRRDLLNNEGDEAFDVLNSLKVSMSTRKLLTAGSVQIEGNEIVIGENRFALNDATIIKETIKELAKSNADQAKKIEKGQKDNERLKKKLVEAEKGTTKQKLSLSDSINGKVLLLIGAYNELITELGCMDTAERKAAQPTIIDRIGEQQTRLYDIFQSDKVFNDDDTEISDELLDALDT